MFLKQSKTDERLQHVSSSLFLASVFNRSISSLKTVDVVKYQTFDYDYRVRDPREYAFIPEL